MQINNNFLKKRVHETEQDIQNILLKSKTVMCNFLKWHRQLMYLFNDSR